MNDASFAEFMNSLPGGISLEEAIYLRHLASEVRHGCIVEVGSFRGKSAIALALGVRLGQQKTGSAKSPQIWCVEPHAPFTGYYGRNFSPSDRGAYYENMLKLETFREVALINLSSEVIAPNWKEPVALAFIDGDHRYDGVLRDFVCWDPHIFIGGTLVLDDAGDPECGVSRLANEITLSGRYDSLGMKGKMAIFRKM